MSAFFNGTGRIATVSAALGTPTSLSVFCWAKTYSSTPIGCPVANYADAANNFNFQMVVLAGGTLAVNLLDSGAAAVGAVSPLPNTARQGGWSAYGFTWASGLWRLFVDGTINKSDANAPTAIHAATNPVYVGSRPDAGAGFHGLVAHVAIWIGSTLTTTDIVSLCKGLSPLRIRKKDLWAYWPLAPGPGALADLSGNGRTLNIVTNPVQFVPEDPPLAGIPAIRIAAPIPAAAVNVPFITSATSVYTPTINPGQVGPLEGSVSVST